MKFSALIPYKPDTGVRDRIWSLVRERYRRFFPTIDICLGLDESDPFCRSRAVNRAASQAVGDVFIIVDTDVVFNGELIDGIKKGIQERCWLIPFENGFRLNQHGTERLMSQRLPDRIIVKHEDILFNERVPGTHMNVMTRRCFESVGGLDERFSGWGYEDTALVAALDTFCGKHLRLPGDVFHLWHPPARVYPERLQANQSLWERYKKATGRIIEMRLLMREWRS